VLGGNVFFEAVVAAKALVADGTHRLSQVDGQVALAVVFSAERAAANVTFVLAVAAPDNLGKALVCHNRLLGPEFHFVACKVKKSKLPTSNSFGRFYSRLSPNLFNCFAVFYLQFILIYYYKAQTNAFFTVFSLQIKFIKCTQFIN